MSTDLYLLGIMESTPSGGAWQQFKWKMLDEGKAKWVDTDDGEEGTSGRDVYSISGDHLKEFMDADPEDLGFDPDDYEIKEEVEKWDGLFMNWFIERSY